MRQRTIRFLSVLCALALLCTSALAAAWDWGEPDRTPREWTIMVFLNGDNNLEQDALADLKEMEKSLPDGGTVEVIALLDRSDRYATTYGDWSGARVYRVRRSDAKDEIASTLLADPGPLDMSDANVLVQFVKAATAKYPAQKTALVMWNHGGGWGGMSSDEGARSGNKTPQMSLAAFEKALTALAPEQPGGKFELLHFDMCLMGQAEVAAACAPYARYMVASTPVEPAMGMDYVKFLPLFAAGKPTDELITDAVHAGCQTFLDNGQLSASLSAYDLSRADRFVRAWRKFSDALLSEAGASWTELTRSFFWAQNYGPEGDDKRGMNSIASVDLSDWLGFIRKLPLGEKLKREIEDLRRAGEGMTIASESGPSQDRCGGLSFYAPLRANNLRPDYAETTFDRATGWSDVLNVIYARQAEEGMAPPRVTAIEIGSPVQKAGVKAPKGGADFTIRPASSVVPLSGGDLTGTYVKITIEGQHILRAYAGFAMAEKASGPYTIYTHQILHNEHIDDTQEKSVFPTFRNGKNELLYQFGGLMHLFWNEEKQISPVTVNYLTVSGNEYAVRGVYSDPVIGERDAMLTLDARYNSTKTLTAVGPDGVSNITPRPEGTFTPVLDVIENGKIVHKRGDTALKWGNGLHVAYGMFPKGSFAAVLASAESLGGAGTNLMSRRLPVAANPQLEPFQENARGHLNELDGMFFTLGAVPHASGKSMMIAPTGSHWMLDSDKAYGKRRQSATIITPSETKKFSFAVTPVGLPMLTLYHKDKRGLAAIDSRFFAVRVGDGGKAYWRLTDGTTGAPLLLIPQHGELCPDGWLNGTWTGDAGSTLTAGNGRFSLRTQDGKTVAGTFEVTGDAVRVTDSAGTPHFYNGFVDQGRLALTDMLAGTVEVFTPGTRRPAPPQPPAAPSPVQAPPRPRPPVPPTVMEKRNATLSGTWGLQGHTNVDVFTFTGNRYTRRTLGVPETGIYTLSAPPRSGASVVWAGTVTGGRLCGMRFRNTIRMIGQNRMMITFGDDGTSALYVRIR